MFCSRISLLSAGCGVAWGQHRGGQSIAHVPVLWGGPSCPGRPRLRTDRLFLPVRHDSSSRFVVLPPSSRVFRPLPLHRPEPLPQYRQFSLLLASGKYLILLVLISNAICAVNLYKFNFLVVYGNRFLGKSIIFWIFAEWNWAGSALHDEVTSWLHTYLKASGDFFKIFSDWWVISRKTHTHTHMRDFQTLSRLGCDFIFLSANASTLVLGRGLVTWYGPLVFTGERLLDRS